MTSCMLMISGNSRRMTIQKTTKLLLFSILQCKLSKFTTQMGLYCSKQLETTFHQFYEKVLHIIFQVNLGHPFPPRVLLHLFWKREIVERGFLQAGCPSCHPVVSVKALKGTQSTNPNQQLASSFVHPPPDGRSVGAFTPAP